MPIRSCWSSNGWLVLRWLVWLLRHIWLMAGWRLVVDWLGGWWLVGRLVDGRWLVGFVLFVVCGWLVVGWFRVVGCLWLVSFVLLVDS